MPGSVSGCRVWALQIGVRRTPSRQTASSSGSLHPGAGGRQATESRSQRRATGETDAPISCLPSVSRTPAYMCPSCSLKTPPRPRPAPTHTPPCIPYLCLCSSRSRRGGSEALSASQRRETTDFLRSTGSGCVLTCVSDLCLVMFPLAPHIKNITDIQKRKKS